MENKYSRGKIYKVVCNTTGLCYIGSTTYDRLSNRLSAHKCDFKRWKLQPNINKCSSVKVMENENYEIILIENFPCQNKDELRKRERFWIENINCVNLNIPSQTTTEYKEKNKDLISEKRKIFYNENQDKMIERATNYRINNPDKIKALNKKATELPPILCECGMTYTYKHKARHFTTKRHQDALIS